MNMQEYGHLSRGAFHAGIVALRLALKKYAAIQLGLKQELRQPHTSETWKLQIGLHVNRREITALLNVYAHVRGKAQAHGVDKWDSAEYLNSRHYAQKVFDDAVNAYATQQDPVESFA